jgi:hypothetical protein
VLKKQKEEKNAAQKTCAKRKNKKVSCEINPFRVCGDVGRAHDV